MRHNKIERLGVIETDRIITKYFGWIFREQPIIDVGLDAIIEQSIDGNPTGKFIAAQIKSGAGNFHVSEKRITHYVSNIHYNYWLNLDIPIILVAYFPETEKTLWQHINERNFKRTKKQWKLEIPSNQELNEKAKDRLTAIIESSKNKSFVFELYRGKVEPDTLFDIAENVNCLSDSVSCVKRIVELLKELKSNTNNFNIRLNNFIKAGLSDRDAQVKATFKNFGKSMNLVSKRMENEIELFSKAYSEGIYAYEQVVLIYHFLTQNSQEIESAKKSLEKIPPAVNDALSGISFLRNGVSNLPNKYAVLKEAKFQFLEVIDLVVNEFTVSKTMAENIIKNIEKK